jgi:molybdate transport system substrate-binding protein
MGSRPAARRIALLAAALMAAASVSCGCAVGSASTSAAPPASRLTVFAAASLKSALERARAAYELATPGVTLALSTDSSATLATQIEQGAPVDVFLAADTKHPRQLVEAGLTAGDAVSFATSRLTVIVPRGNPAGLASPADLARSGLKVVAAGDEVPITGYASRLVANLAKVAGYPAGFAAGYAANVVSREDNARAVVAKIELGEGDAAIAYETDAKASTGVDTLAIPDGANVSATYAGVVVRGSANPAAAAAFLAWLAGSDGQAILADLGFRPAP